MTPTVEWLRAGDEAARNDLTGQAFGQLGSFVPEHVLPNDQILAVYAGDELVGSAALLDGGHWFGAKPVGGHGVSGVSVAAHRRGEGIGKRLLRELLNTIHERGGAISGLYPTSVSLYRSLGYEFAGERTERRIQVGGFDAAAVADARVEPLAVDDLLEVAPAYDALVAQGSGGIARGNRWWWHRQRVHRQDKQRAYLYRVTVGADTGYVAMHASASERGVFDLTLTDLGAESAGVLSAIGGVIGGFGTVVDQVMAHQPHWALQALTAHGQHWATHTSQGWMLRIINAAAAIEQRGWAPLDATVSLAIVDPLLPQNSGNAVLVAEAGTAHLEPGGPGTWTMPITAMAAWFTGWRTATQLASLGLIHGPGDPRELDVLDALTAGPVPAIPEFY